MKALVADDEPEIREIIQFELGELGFETHAVASGNAAIKFLQSNSVDLIVSDVRMPNGSGLDLLDWCRTRDHVWPPVLFMTGFADITLQDAFHRGADAVFSKPIDQDQFIETIAASKLSQATRLSRPTTNLLPDVTLEQETNAEQYASSGPIAFGRGGMFLACTDIHVQPHDIVAFDIVNRTKGTFVKGLGVVRWMRRVQQTNAHLGIGIEFLALEDEYLHRFLDFVAREKPVAYIPRGNR